MRPLIAIATFRRPEGLATLLASLEKASATREFDVIVVDNDAAGTARTVAEASPLNIVYVVEPRPGIAAARNRALDEIAAYDAIVFVDDDEYVTPGWLDLLIDHITGSTADVVIGPVESVFPSNAPRWVVRGGFIQRPTVPTGTQLTAGATNNTLLLTSSWRKCGAPRFDETFSSTGGSDAKIFSILLAEGARIEFVREALVYEPVLPERMKLKWLLRRAYRNGIVSARIWVPKHGRVKTLVRGAMMTANGLVRVLAHFVTLRGVQASSFNTFVTGLGVISAVTGVRVHEYKRPTG
jgi:glycosyltransferase involved in cell wall biosynthesis